MSEGWSWGRGSGKERAGSRLCLVDTTLGSCTSPGGMGVWKGFRFWSQILNSYPCHLPAQWHCSWGHYLTTPQYLSQCSFNKPPGFVLKINLGNRFKEVERHLPSTKYSLVLSQTEADHLEKHPTPSAWLASSQHNYRCVVRRLGADTRTKEGLWT